MTALHLPARPMGVAERPRAAAVGKIADAPAGAPFLAAGMLLGGVLIGSAAAINDGRLHWQGLQWLTLGLLAMAAALTLCRSRVAGRVGERGVTAVAAIACAFQLAHVALCGMQTSAGANLPPAALGWYASVSAVGVAVAVFTRRAMLGGAVVVAAFAAAAFAAIWTHPHVRIDVWMFQAESAQALLDGRHPYAVRYRDVYWPAGTAEFYGPGASAHGWLAYSFPYPPASLLLVLPGHLLGDVRYAHAAALAAAAALLMHAGRSRLAVLAGAALLTSPRSLLVVTMGWTEPLLILLAAGTVYAAARGRGLWLTVGLWLAIKQYMILLLPLLGLLGPTPRSRQVWRRTALPALLLAAAVTLPFFVTRPGAFVDSVMLWQFVQPFRYDALSFPAMAAQLGAGEAASPLVPLTIAAVATLLAWWKAPRNAGGMMAAAALVYGVFFAFSKQAFCNYYLFVVGLCCCAAAALAGATGEDVTTRAGERAGKHRIIDQSRGGRVVRASGDRRVVEVCA